MTKKGFNPELHKQILIKILVDIFKRFNGKLKLKGGTCAYLFYDLPRISLDLDFDVLEELDSDEIGDLKVILEKYGKLKDFREKRWTIFFLLNYKTDAPNVKIELNKRVWRNNSYKTVWFLGVEMRIDDEATLLTNKLVALSDRRVPVARDIFDVYYLLKLGFSINENLVKERTGKELKDYLKFLVSFIKKTYTPKNILQGLGEILEKAQRDWAREKLIQDTVQEIERLIKWGLKG